MTYTYVEQLCVSVSRELKDGGVGFIGLGTGGRSFTLAVGVPTVAIELAKRNRGIDYIAQYGVALEPDIGQTPHCFADPYLLAWSATGQQLVEHCLDNFRRGFIDVGFISGAQIDPRGNVNSVCIGDQKKPKTRLVGVIAQGDHAAYAGNTFIIIPQEKRTFVPKVDFISAVGFGDAPDARDRLALPGGGPHKVFTDKAIWGFDPKTKVMRLESRHAWITPDDLVDSVGYRLDVPKDLPVTAEPTADELRLIREIDPQGLFLEAKIV